MYENLVVRELAYRQKNKRIPHRYPPKRKNLKLMDGKTQELSDSVLNEIVSAPAVH